jgi:hypothetical protein
MIPTAESMHQHLELKLILKEHYQNGYQRDPRKGTRRDIDEFRRQKL